MLHRLDRVFVESYTTLPLGRIFQGFFFSFCVIGIQAFKFLFSFKISYLKIIGKARFGSF